MTQLQTDMVKIVGSCTCACVQVSGSETFFVKDGDCQTCMHCTGYEGTMSLLDSCYRRNSASAKLSTGSSVGMVAAGLTASFATGGLATPISVYHSSKLNTRAKRKQRKRDVLKQHIERIRGAGSVIGCKCYSTCPPDAVQGHIYL